MDWSTLYPEYFLPSSSSDETATEGKKANTKQVEFADVGCGYGGLLGLYNS